MSATTSALRARLRSLAREQPEVLGQILRQIYGDKITPEQQLELIDRARRDHFPMPRIEWVDGELLQGALGASSLERGGPIFLSTSLATAPEYLAAVLIEEVGHHLDTWLGGADTAGDEGLMFLVTVARSAPLTQDELGMARRQRDEGTMTRGERTLRVEFAVPVAVAMGAYLGKAAAATTVDAFLEYGIAAVTGTPPGVLTHVANFATNLTPGLGEARKVQKLARLLNCIDAIIGTVKVLERVPNGGRRLLREMEAHRDALAKAVESGDLSRAKGAFGNILGRLREAQIASRLHERGAEIIHLRRNLVNAAGDVITDIDVITREGGQLFCNQVKVGSRGVIREGSDTWPLFIKEVEETLRFAAQHGARVRYYLDDVSPEVLSHLRKQGIDVLASGDFLR